jgi:hypothetical protein
MLNDNDVREMCRKLKPVMGQKADRLWIMYLAEDEKGRRELAADIQLIAEKFLSRNERQILLEPPLREKASGLFYLGDVIYNGKNLYPLFLTPEDFIKQIGIFSITGEGKTNTAKLLALQLLKFRIPFLVVDWKRAWRKILNYKGNYPGLDFRNPGSFNVEDVQVFTIGRNINQLEWNPFRSPPKADPVMWISTVAEVLEKSHISGMGVGALINRIYSKKFRELGINSDSTYFPNFYDGLKELEGLYARERELKWKQTTLRIFESFTTGPASKAFNSRNPLRLENLLDKPIIFELDLEMPKALRVFFSEIILRWIHLYRLGQGESEKLRHVLFLEEVHNMFQKDRYENDKTDSLENIYRECRGFGQGIVSITQHPSLLPVWMLGNCHTQIYLGLQHEADIRAAKQSLFLKYEEQEYLNMLKVGEAIVKVKNRIEPCLVKIPFVPLGDNIEDEWLKTNMRGYLAGLHEYKTSAKGGYLAGDNKEGRESAKYPNTLLQRILEDIFLMPLSSVTQRYARLKVSPETGNRYKNNLISEGFIRPRKIITNSGWITLLEPTQKGRMMLSELGYKAADDRESIEHKFWKFKIAEYYKKKGFDVLVEEHVNGRPDIIVINGEKKVAVEIETGESYAIKNIEKNLKAGFDEVVCVAVNKEVKEKIRQELEKNNLIDSKIKITCVFEFEI